MDFNKKHKVKHVNKYVFLSHPTEQAGAAKNLIIAFNLKSEILRRFVPQNDEDRILFCRHSKKIILLFIILLLTNFSGCFYSFTGASVPEHLETIAISVFDDRSGSGEPALGDFFTNELIQKFINDNTLQIAEKANANALLEGSISSITDAPSVVSGGEKVSTRRINITVKVVYRDFVKKTTVFDKSFTNFGDYATDASSIPDARKEAINGAIDRITEDILLSVVSNW